VAANPAATAEQAARVAKTDNGWVLSRLLYELASSTWMMGKVAIELTASQARSGLEAGIDGSNLFPRIYASGWVSSGPTDGEIWADMRIGAPFQRPRAPIPRRVRIRFGS